MRVLYDTSSLLLTTEETLFNTEDEIYISSVTLNELESIKTNLNKTEELRQQARKIVKLLEKNTEKYHLSLYSDNYYENALYLCGDDYYDEHINYLPQNNDSKILVSCLIEKIDLLYTNDLLMKLIATSLGIKTKKLEIQEQPYLGYKQVELSEEMANDFYSDPTINYFNLNINEYLIIKNGKDTDLYRWDGKKHSRLTYPKNLGSKFFGDLAPLEGDIYQAFACDSLNRNQFTMLKGPAGTGKSYLALGYLFHLLDTNKIEQIIIFCNTVAAKNAARLGFYPGTKDEKLLDSQIGNMLSGKLGGIQNVKALVETGKLLLLPFADIRGFDTNNKKVGIYITEAQNLDIDLMKLAIQRVGENNKLIIEGDDESQVDHSSYEGVHNGMKRVSQVFRGKDLYGEVKLQKIHRSKIAEIAEAM